jgi:uncharacterized protein
VNARAAVLTALEAKLKQFGNETGNQVVVWIGRTLPADTTIEEYANASFNLWGIGQKEKNNGVLLMLFVKSRKMRIETGDGIRDRLPDVRAALIIDGMKPKLRASDYDAAIVDATDEILKALNPPPPVRNLAAEIDARRGVNPLPAATPQASPPMSTPELVGACAIVLITAVVGLLLLILIIKAVISGLARGFSGGGTTFSSGGTDYTRVDHYHHGTGGGWRGWGSGSRNVNNTIVRTVVHREPRVTHSSSSDSGGSSSSSSGGSSGGGFSGGGSSSGGGASGSW